MSIEYHGINIQNSFSLAATIPSNAWTNQNGKILAYLLQRIGRRSGWLQSDNAGCIMVLSRTGTKDIDGVAIRYAPTYSSQPQGSVALFNLSISEQIRTYRLVIDLQHQVTITVDHPMFAAIVFRYGSLITSGLYQMG